MNNQEPSTSFTTKNIMDNGEEKKEDPKSESENKVENEKNCFIDDLPPEMLMKILKHLDVQSLAVSRLMNRRWNGIAREILQSRDDVEIEFQCRKNEDGSITIGKKGTQKGSLEDFINCFEASKESPLYTRFCFNDIRASVFDHSNWIKFVSDFGESTKCLKFVMPEERSVDEMIHIAEKLRKLLLNQLPNLSEFGFYFSFIYGHGNNSPSTQIQLFPTTTTAQLQLPNLKVLYLDETAFSNYTRIFTDLLRAAGNLQEIKPFYYSDTYNSIQSLYLLQSLGKLHCLQAVEIRLCNIFLSKIKDKPSVPLPSKLKRLDLDVKPRFIDVNTFSEASVFLSNLFKANQDTLNSLTMNPIGFLPHLQLPKFNKLTYLGIGGEYLKKCKQALPSKLNVMEIFPALKILNLRGSWIDFFPHGENSSDSSFQTLKTLTISGRGLTTEVITRISQACPNLKELEIGQLLPGTLTKNFPEVGTAIWTHLKQIQSLQLNIHMNSLANAFPAVDSCITGFSGEYCQRLYDFIQTGHLEAGGTVSQSEFEMEMEGERKNPSILDLKDLRNLTVSLFSGNRSDDEELDELSKNVTTVSKNYAFKLMDNLTYKIEKVRM